MSRLEFGPKPREMEVTDIATGHFVFRPVEGKEVSYEELDEAIENAGYEIEDATITVTGAVTDERHLESPNGQLFQVTEGEAAGENALAELAPGAKVTVRGAWRSTDGVNVVVAAEIRPAGRSDGDREGS